MERPTDEDIKLFYEFAAITKCLGAGLPSKIKYELKENKQTYNFKKALAVDYELFTGYLQDVPSNQEQRDKMIQRLNDFLTLHPSWTFEVNERIERVNQLEDGFRDKMISDSIDRLEKMKVDKTERLANEIQIYIDKLAAFDGITPQIDTLKNPYIFDETLIQSFSVFDGLLWDVLNKDWFRQRPTKINDNIKCTQPVFCYFFNQFKDERKMDVCSSPTDWLPLLFTPNFNYSNQNKAIELFNQVNKDNRTFRFFSDKNKIDCLISKIRETLVS
jgi:hypothetical protein